MSIRAVHQPHCAMHRFGGGPCDCGTDIHEPHIQNTKESMGITNDEIKRLRELWQVAAATPGGTALPADMANLALFAAVRNALPKLLEAAEASLPIEHAGGFIPYSRRKMMEEIADLKANIQHLRDLAACGLDNISTDPLAGYRHISAACDKALATPANGGEANG